MDRMKILFIICVCNFAPSQSPFVPVKEIVIVQIDKEDFKKFQGFDVTALRDIEIESDPNIIDFSKTQFGTLEYYQKVMLLFCQILDNRFLKNRRPTWPALKTLENLEQDTEKIDSSRVEGGKEGYPVSPPHDTEHTEVAKDTLPIPLSQKINQLKQISFDLLIKYDALIQPKGYVDRAFYFNILEWLKTKLADKEHITPYIENIFKLRIKAENYLYDFMTRKKLNEIYDYGHEKWNILYQWQYSSDVYNDALSFIDDITISGGQAANVVTLKCAEIVVYEDLLHNADALQFQKVMRMEKWDALRLVDKSFHTKRTVMDPFSHPVKVEKINLIKYRTTSLAIHGKAYTAPYYKRIGMLFVKAIESYFDIPILSKETHRELITFPERHLTYGTLRYCTFQWWLVKVIEEIRSNSKVQEKMKYLLARSYLYRVFSWFMFQLLKDDNKENLKECKHLLHSLSDFLANNSIIHLSTAVYQIGASSPHSKFESIIDIDSLKKLGIKKDKALASIHRITVELLKEDGKIYNQMLQYLLEEKQPNEQIVSQIEHYRSTVTTNEKALSKLLQYGDVEPNTILCEPSEYYQKLISEMDQSNFEFIFYCKTDVMLNKIKKELKKICKIQEQ